MQLVNVTTHKIITVFLLSILLNSNTKAQDNSPYSRYGLGDLSNSTNILQRGMGGISVGYSSVRFLNVSNPASYATFGSLGSSRSNAAKLISFEVGTEYNGRTLIQSNPVGKYKSSNLIFNYMQLGMQLSKKGNWGLTFGLMPVARENYKIANFKRIAGVDSAFTLYEGTGGAYKGFIGTGYKHKNLSLGINTGYFFGKKNTSTELNLLNDSVIYFESISNNKVNYGNVFFQLGAMYDYQIDKSKETPTTLKFGLTYELQNKLRANQDVERLTKNYNYTTNPAYPEDSIFVQKDIKGTIVVPATLGFGLTYQKEITKTGKAVVVGLDYVSTSWNQYRYFGQADQVQTNWTIKSGIQLTPAKVGKNYWNSVDYRFGFNYGKDYIKAGGDLPVYAVTLGLGLPLFSDDRYRPTPMVNLALEAGKRGNNQNVVRENFIRVALSLSLADVWFARRRYD